MMNTQLMTSFWKPAASAVRTLRDGRILPLGTAGGCLEVLHGRVWLTRAGDPDDHVVESGQTICIPPLGSALVESWDEAQPALVAWRPGSVTGRIRAAFKAAFGHCWDIVDPARRLGAGSLAAAVALIAGALLFGPLSDARTRALAAPTVLHNSVGTSSRVNHDAGATKGPAADGAARPQERARVAAQEARRRAAGAA